MRAMLHLPRLVLDFGAVKSLPDELSRLGVRNPLLISDAGLAACGVLDRARAAAPAIAHVFDRVRENPVFADCDAAADAYREGACDGIVALGGGSVIDAAKMAAVLASHGGRSADFAGRSELVSGKVVPLVVLPTTAGTGSEASGDAGVHPDAISPTLGVSSPFIVPLVALCDPELTMTLPQSLTAATGIDALTHCIEGYLATTPSPPIDAMALDGLRRVCRNVERAVQDGRDRQARWEMMVAAFEGGAAISKGLGPAHAIAIGCGDQGVHHGKLSAIGLLAWLGGIGQHGGSKLGDIAAAMDLAPGQTVQAGLLDLMQRLRLPVTLAEAGYRVGDVDKIASECAGSFFNLTSPYKPTAAEYRAMINTVAG